MADRLLPSAVAIAVAWRGVAWRGAAAAAAEWRTSEGFSLLHS